MKATMKGLRVTEEEEIMGLDMSEHGSYGYPELLQSETAKTVDSKTLTTGERPVNA